MLSGLRRQPDVQRKVGTRREYGADKMANIVHKIPSKHPISRAFEWFGPPAAALEIDSAAG
jgi:hypothetical protein